MALIIEKGQIKDLLKELKERFEVFDSRKSILPPKQYFFPPREEIFKINKATNQLINANSPKEFIVFGLNLADLEAITQLDEIMEKPQPDFFYLQKREKATIIGLTEESFEIAPGGDIILEKINPEQYQVKYLTKKGKKITSKFFKEADVKIEKYPRKLTKLQKMLIDSELLAEAVDWSKNHKIWNELAETCLGCAICTYLCPLCYCFSIEDRVSLDDKECSRCRNWDACTLPDFSKIAGGHSFRETLKQRYYNWFYHKFVRAYREYGKAQCVGCTRCQDNCPAGIDIEKVLETILKDFKKK